jgi:adenylate cyclase
MLSLRRGEMGPGTVELTVGFADLVGFTLLSQELSDQALADLVSRFEALAHETVTTRGGRVVKMIGDAVMYAVRDAETSAEIALSLSDAYADDDLLSDVRVGLACGPVVAKDGDYFGPVVNLASRIVNVAKPGTVLTSDEVHETLEDRDGLTWRPLRPRQLRDVGRVQLWSLSREGDERATQDRWAWGRRRGRPGVVPAAGEILARVNELGSRRSS